MIIIIEIEMYSCLTLTGRRTIVVYMIAHWSDKDSKWEALLLHPTEVIVLSLNPFF